MSKPTLLIHTHWQVAQSHPAIQNLPKSMAAPTHGRQESAANLKDNETDENERQCTTRGIKHWGLSGYANILPRIKFGVSGQESSTQSPTISYRHPLCAMQRKPTHIQAHLVFADTKANAEKPKELEFLPTLDRNE